MLFDGIDDAALLFTPEQLRKNYTAGQVSKLEQLREAVFMLIPMWPTEDIARHLKLSTRTVRALSATDAEKVAGSKREFIGHLRSTAGRWLALARTREHEANFQQLAIGLGIILDKARDLEGLDTGEVGEKESVKEAEEHAAAAAKLRAWFEEGVAGSPPATDLQSKPQALIANGLSNEDGQRAGNGAKPVPPGQPEGQPTPGGAAGPAEGEGRSKDRTEGNTPMGELSGDCSAKAPGTWQDTPPPKWAAGPEKNAATPAQPPASPTPGGEP